MVPHSISLYIPLVLLGTYLLSAQLVAAQVLVNGQLFTNALAIVDAPAPNSNYQAGNTIAIAVDVSGNGKLSQPAQVPGCSLSTRFEGLQIFLISDSSEFNMTISDGNTLLYQESSSNVKHVTWTIPSCTPSGNYAVTLYETSIINNKAFYTITPIPVIIYSSNPGQCSDLNQFQGVPQLSSPSPQSPWLTSECSTRSTGATITNNPIRTRAQFIAASSTMQIVTAPLPEYSYGPWTLTIGEIMPTTITSVVVYVETFTEVFSGLTTTAMATMSTLMTSEVELPMSSIDFVGFIPINAEKHLGMVAVATLMAGGLTILTIMTLLTLL